MFTRKPQRPHHPFFSPPSGRHSAHQRTAQDLIAYFRTSEGHLDFEKMAETAQQAKQVFNQVSPLISPVIKKFLK
ncbi:hypothetical protein FZC66_11315 [Priestia megaterium]|nr:hypothetical protein FZC66_11315 [Priestia megaterium]